MARATTLRVGGIASRETQALGRRKVPLESWSHQLEGGWTPGRREGATGASEATSWKGWTPGRRERATGASEPPAGREGHQGGARGPQKRQSHQQKRLDARTAPKPLVDRRPLAERDGRRDGTQGYADGLFLNGGSVD